MATSSTTIAVGERTQEFREGVSKFNVLDNISKENIKLASSIQVFFREVMLPNFSKEFILDNNFLESMIMSLNLYSSKYNSKLNGVYYALGYFITHYDSSSVAKINRKVFKAVWEFSKRKVAASSALSRSRYDDSNINFIHVVRYCYFFQKSLVN